MELLDIARKFTANPSSCTDAEIQELAANFNTTHPQVQAVLDVANAYPHGKAEGMFAAIRRAHFERSNLEALSRNPFADPGNLPQVAGDNPLAELSQGELAQMVFKA